MSDSKKSVSIDITGKVKVGKSLFPVTVPKVDITSDKGIDRNEAFHWFTDMEVFESASIKVDGKLVSTIKPVDIANGVWSTLTVKPHIEEHTNTKGEVKQVHSVRQDWYEVLRNTLHGLVPLQFDKFGSKDGGGKVSDDNKNKVIKYLKKNYPVEDISDMTGLSLNTVKRIASSVKVDEVKA